MSQRNITQIDNMLFVTVDYNKGGSGSGNWSHSGRIGIRGGSGGGGIGAGGVFNPPASAYEGMPDAVKGELAFYEKLWIENGDPTVENGVLVNKDGSKHKTEKQEGEISEILTTQKDAQRFSGGYFSHTHPDGLPPSDNDYKYAAKYDMQELRAVSADGSQIFRIKRPPDGFPKTAIEFYENPKYAAYYEVVNVGGA